MAGNLQVAVTSLVVVSPQPHPRLLDLEDAASTLADLITYTPPSLPPTLPKQVRSAGVVARQQEASSVEAALVLTSVLLGAGYRALVVQGAASPSLVAHDTSHLACPYLVTRQKEGPAGQEEGASKYGVRPPPDLSSRYDVIMEERARRTHQNHHQEPQRKETCASLTQAEQQKQEVGEASGGHLHFWVVVLPPERMVTTPTFIEATTGKVTPLQPGSTLPYTRLDALFHHANYWASVSTTQTIASDMFELSDVKRWLPLYPVVDQGEAGGVLSTSTTLLPSVPRPAPVTITEEALRLRYPGGCREEVYQGVLVRRYSPFSHPHGATIVLRLLHHTGQVREVSEEFEHRADRLVRRVTQLNEGAVTDTFASTRTDTLREHRYWRSPASLASCVRPDGVENPWAADEVDPAASTSITSTQTFLFHSKFRVDALRRREVGETVWREEYDPRPDLLLSRTTTFTTTTTTLQPTIQKIEEEFGSVTESSDGGVAAEVAGGKVAGGEVAGGEVAGGEVVQRRVFQVSEGRILLVYHYGRHRLLQPTRTFLKPPDGRCQSLTSDMTQAFQPDPGAEEPSLPQLWEELARQVAAETRALEEVRRALEETAVMRATRQAEHCATHLLPPLFDVERNSSVQHILRQRQWAEEHREETERQRREEREGRVDTVAPYLPLLKVSEGVEAVRERCLHDLWERLALRANLLQDTLDQARVRVLECREEEGRRKRATGEERAALAGRTTIAEAAHRRIRAHLAAWKHEAAERYEAMVAKLESDSRLNGATLPATTFINTTTLPATTTTTNTALPSTSTLPTITTATTTASQAIPKLTTPLDPTSTPANAPDTEPSTTSLNHSAGLTNPATHNACVHGNETS